MASKTGLVFTLSALTGFGSYSERDYMVEVGLWPHKSAHGVLWVTLHRTGDSIPDWTRTWSLQVPDPRRWIMKGYLLVDKLFRRVVKWCYDESGQTENI